MMMMAHGVRASVSLCITNACAHSGACGGWWCAPRKHRRRGCGRDLTTVSANKRDMGIVFQAYSLFPHMTARQNVAFGLRLRKIGEAERNRRAGEMLELVGLSAQADRYAQFFQLFRNHKDVMTGVTLWGVADDATWLSMFSSGRLDFPLLFDTSHNPKPAYWAVVDF